MVCIPHKSIVINKKVHDCKRLLKMKENISITYDLKKFPHCTNFLNPHKPKGKRKILNEGINLLNDIINNTHE